MSEARHDTRLRFSKMQGAGNDFVVLDLRDGSPPPDAALAVRLADRHFGVGCDQILTIEPPRDAAAVASYRIWNTDGSAAGQCGNGARCVAAWLVRDGSASGADFVIESPAGSHHITRSADGEFAVAMGVPRFAPEDVPLVGFPRARDEYVLPLQGGSVRFGAVSMGNPHAVLEVGLVDAAPVERLGPLLQQHASFPDSVNVGFVQVIDRGHLRLRVYERGVGETLACGSGACAAAAVMMQRGRVERDVRVSLPGGELRVQWPDDAAPVVMSGPATFVFDGEWIR
ncbi:diaminopimelate epimerase [Xanthomonas rydalmerensis]|uniref:Diaminopimelate epimerase n=1 Tax=Xanthomonas rydalmerensis TaxID=3046274 RepID=A0ABZ0JP61_9XANT|nr:diaminopimelate epimerase [Xanthomonas sp. DM-2023]WOS41606.1 diaminopimelate epimerase [Xanthomonas sp. DM-2023]WOS45792.1 diaminopimelate epimerase [Xanthomonas sp. DM-2023]WOS49971.1 diaminopimelate epimerase [Xanthomonas sp. DM-2023]WOS54150.1 diaminopimelate epimerase [Xanthomonas sp. DM-2023]WOS58333.1 diaminopimelate epimerase [Xanthomonas sp. DM-2023]